MPKPVKKPANRPRKPASDPNLRVHQLMAEMEAKQATGQPPPAPLDFESQYKARMAELGKKGGKIGGKRRLKTMTKAERVAVARKAAASRWKKSKRKDS